MNNTIVIYESKYGHTARYANWIAESLSCPLIERKKVTSSALENADTIIYGGGLYAGGVSGIKLLMENWELICNKKIAVFTCGLASPKEPANVAHIREAIAQVLPADMLEKITLFHLHGGIDYSKLSLVHKAMMKMLRKMLLKKPENELTSEDKQLLSTYGGVVDFCNKESIGDVVAWGRK